MSRIVQAKSSLQWRPPPGYKIPDTDDECIADPWWRLNHLYVGVDEDRLMSLSFVMRPQQADFYWKMWWHNIILKITAARVYYTLLPDCTG